MKTRALTPLRRGRARAAAAAASSLLLRALQVALVMLASTGIVTACGDSEPTNRASSSTTTAAAGSKSREEVLEGFLPDDGKTETILFTTGEDFELPSRVELTQPRPEVTEVELRIDVGLLNPRGLKPR